MEEAWKAGRVVSITEPFFVANTAPDLYPRMTWGGPHDAFLILSDAPERLDASNLGREGVTLYADRSAAVRGAVRVLMFHQNATTETRRLGVTVRNLAQAGGQLRQPDRQAAMADTNGTRAGHAVSGAWLAARSRPWRHEPLGAGDARVVLDAEVRPGETLVALVEGALVDDDGRPLPCAVQTWAAPIGLRRVRPEDVWDCPLAPWQTATNTSSKIRATIPHCEAEVAVRAPAGRRLFVDLCAVSPSGGPGASPGASDPTPAGFPLRGRTAAWLAPSHPLAATASTWPYQADPAGFDGRSPATEYVAGWNDADQRAEGVSDPSANPAFWYRSERYGVWMRQWNYGGYGCAVEFAIEAESAAALAVTPARERFSCPWVWYDPASGKAAGVPWDTIHQGLLGTRYGSGGTGFALASGVTSARLVTTVTPGAYAPYRLAIAPAARG